MIALVFLWGIASASQERTAIQKIQDQLAAQHKADQNKASTKPIDLSMKNSPSVLRRMAPFCKVASTTTTQKSSKSQMPTIGVLTQSALKAQMSHRRSRQGTTKRYYGSGASDFQLYVSGYG